MESIYENPMGSSKRVNAHLGDIEMNIRAAPESVEPSTSRQSQREEIVNVGANYNKEKESSSTSSHNAVIIALFATLVILSLAISVASLIYSTQDNRNLLGELRVQNLNLSNEMQTVQKKLNDDVAMRSEVEKFRNATGRMEETLRVLDTKIQVNQDKLEFIESNVTVLQAMMDLQGFDELVAKVNQLQDLLTWYKASNGYYYKVFAERVNYTTGKGKCVEYGGILASRGPRDTHVRGDLVNLMKQGDPYHTWIGANDILNEGTWVWEDGVVSNAMDWYGGQPDNYLGNEDCAHCDSGVGWKVNDRPCDANFKFLCEKKYNVA